MLFICWFKLLQGSTAGQPDGGRLSGVAVSPVPSMEPDEEARKILTTAEDLLVLGKIREALEQSQIARDYYLESGHGCFQSGE